MFDYSLWCSDFRIDIHFSIIPKISMIRPRTPATNATTGLRCVEMNCVMLSIHIPTMDTPVQGSLIRLIIIVSSGILVKYIRPVCVLKFCYNRIGYWYRVESEISPIARFTMSQYFKA